jgi:hypothetical protein
MQVRDLLLLPVVVLAGFSPAHGADQAPAANRPAPVSVSSANYQALSREEMSRLDVEGVKTNPPTRSLLALDKPQRYVFIPGELYEADLGFDEICQRLAGALAKRGFVNATDNQGRVIAPQEVDLLLRVHAGERPWRQPTVRMSSLTWRDGLVERPRGRSLATLGGDVYWETRSGGNDDALGAAARNEAASGFGYGSSPATPAGGTPLTAGSASSIAMANASGAEYDATLEFYLIVVDAFSFEEVQKKGANAKRLWTTFVAAPRQRNEKFSDVLATMLRVATPYFGETTSGLQMFNDARAEVTLGEMRVMESGVKLPEKK